MPIDRHAIVVEWESREPGWRPGWRVRTRMVEAGVEVGAEEKDKATHSSILAWRIPWTE